MARVQYIKQAIKYWRTETRGNLVCQYSRLVFQTSFLRLQVYINNLFDFFWSFKANLTLNQNTVPTQSRRTILSFKFKIMIRNLSYSCMFDTPPFTCNFLTCLSVSYFFDPFSFRQSLQDRRHNGLELGMTSEKAFVFLCTCEFSQDVYS